MHYEKYIVDDKIQSSYRLCSTFKRIISHVSSKNACFSILKISSHCCLTTAIYKHNDTMILLQRHDKQFGLQLLSH